MTVKKDKGGFSQFFREDDKFIREVIQADRNADIKVKKEEAVAPAIPILPAVKSAGDKKLREYWQSLRKFFSTGQKDGKLPKGLYPVVLAPQLTRSLVGLEFPVWVNTGYPNENDLPLTVSFYKLLIDAFEQIDEKRFDLSILGPNLQRIIHIANKDLKKKPAAFFTEMHDRIKEGLLREIDMGEKDRKELEQSLMEMNRKLPREGILIPYSEDLPFLLLEAVMMALQERERGFLLEDIHHMANRLNDLIKVEEEKGPGGKDPEKLRDALGAAGSMVQVDALSAFLPDTGSEPMDPERLERIRNMVATLEKAPELFSKRSYIFVEEGKKKSKGSPWEKIFETSEVHSVKTGEGCLGIEVAFRKIMPECSRVLAAFRAAELELEARYQPDIHDDYFEQFSWENLSREELHSCPFFVLIAEAETILEKEGHALKDILNDNLPINFLGMKSEIRTRQEDGKVDLHSHHELTGMLLSHKNLFVSQTASITPSYMMQAMEQGMSSFSPAFFHILDIDENTHEQPMVLSSAMIEARDFPGFIYNGLLGTPWGSRFDISNNPQSSQSWPEHTMKISFLDGEQVDMNFNFTFADQAALFEDYHQYFQVVEPAYWTENLVPVDVYMEQHPEENIGKVPFIWMVDSDNTLHKVAVSWQIIMAAEERRDQWRFLQENSGIHNFHVKKAVEELREKLEAQFQRDLDAIRQQHAEEIEKVRLEEADKVMENLTNVLLNLDISSAAGAINAMPATPAAPVDAPEDAEPAEDAPETVPEAEETAPEEETLISEPYIDTALCTTCNECININQVMFKYNADKLAYIADPKAGTYAELVEAAENCPVGIIHPGEPLNPNEPGLEGLKERAKKYN